MLSHHTYSEENERAFLVSGQPLKVFALSFAPRVCDVRCRALKGPLRLHQSLQESNNKLKTFLEECVLPVAIQTEALVRHVIYNRPWSRDLPPQPFQLAALLTPIGSVCCRSWSTRMPAISPMRSTRSCMTTRRRQTECECPPARARLPPAWPQSSVALPPGRAHICALGSGCLPWSLKQNTRLRIH